MSPSKIAERRLNFINSYFTLEEIEVPGFIVEDWGCEARAFGRRLPCLPAGLGYAVSFVIADYAEFANAGTLIFDGYALPRVRKVLSTPALALPKDFEELVKKSIKHGDFWAKTWGRARSAKAYIKRGDEVCIVSHYDGLWYAFAHSATALAALSLWDTRRTLLFVPRYARWEDLLINCKTSILIDGIGVSRKGLGSGDLYLTIGGLTEFYGSPFDTPDKISEAALKRHVELLRSIIN